MRSSTSYRADRKKFHRNLRKAQRKGGHGRGASWDEANKLYNESRLHAASATQTEQAEKLTQDEAFAIYEQICKEDDNYPRVTVPLGEAFKRCGLEEGIHYETETTYAEMKAKMEREDMLRRAIMAGIIHPDAEGGTDHVLGVAPQGIIRPTDAEVRAVADNLQRAYEEATIGQAAQTAVRIIKP